MKRIFFKSTQVTPTEYVKMCDRDVDAVTYYLGKADEEGWVFDKALDALEDENIELLFKATNDDSDEDRLEGLTRLTEIFLEIIPHDVVIK